MTSEHFSFAPEELLADASRRFVSQLTSTVGLSERRDELLSALDAQSAHWGGRRCGDAPPRTIVSPVGSPIECSIAIDAGCPELRWSVDLVTVDGTRSAHREAAWRYLEHLASRGNRRAGALLSILAPLRDGFFCMFGLVCRGDAPLGYKLYLHGWYLDDPRAFPWRELLHALGAADLAQALAAARGPHDRVIIIAIDLDDGPDARIKAYTQFSPENSLDTIRRYEPLARVGRPNAIARFRHLALQGLDALGFVEVLSVTARPARSSGAEHLTFSLMNVPHALPPDDDESDAPPGSDRFFQRGVHAVLSEYGLSSSTYDQVLETMTVAPPEESYYFNTYLSYQERTTGAPRITTYFAPQFFASRMREVLGADQLR